MKHVFVGCVGLLLASPLGGQAEGLEVEVSPMFGYRFGGSVETSAGDDLDLAAGIAYGVAFEAGPRGADYKLGLFWSRQESGIDFKGAGGLQEVDMTVDQYMFSSTLTVYEAYEGRFRAEFSGMVGATVFDVEREDAEARFCFGLGLGAKYFLLKNLAVRADVRGFCTIVESEGAFISSGGNAVVYFSGSTLWQGEVAVALTLAF